MRLRKIFWRMVCRTVILHQSAYQWQRAATRIETNVIGQKQTRLREDVNKTDLPNEKAL